MTPEDKDKFLHTNESTGALEWAAAPSGGGMLKITCTVVEDLPVINKTWQEIHDAEGAYIYINAEDVGQRFWYLAECAVDNGAYRAGFFRPVEFSDGLVYFTASAANDIPVFTGHF